MPVRIKICGIRSVTDLKTAILAGADAIGLNFYRQSIRYIQPDKTKELIRQTPPGVTLVGVFANASIGDLQDVLNFAPEIQCFQFHGNLPNLDLLQGRQWIGVVSASRETSVLELQKEIESLMGKAIPPSAILVDTKIEGLLGGTGVVGPWNVISQCTFPVPLILAGGLNPINIQQAIQTVKPYMVDVASGVESSPGVKCPQKMTSFAEQVIRFTC